jgi:hypothetical protein
MWKLKSKNPLFYNYLLTFDVTELIENILSFGKVNSKSLFYGSRDP